MKTEWLKSFCITRDTFLKTIRGISETEADGMPPGFVNTIRWNVGHVLTTADRTLVGSKVPMQLPQPYREMFLPSTSPAGWNQEAPTMAQLADQLVQQKALVLEQYAGPLDEPLASPIELKLYDGHVLYTFGELLGFFAFHEAMHIGYVKALKRALQLDA